MNRKIIVLLFFALCFFMCCASKQIKFENAQIETSIEQLEKIKSGEKDPTKIKQIESAIEKLKFAKEKNIENDKLKQDIKADSKYTKAGKWLYGLGGLVLILFCAFIVFRAVRFFVRI